MTIGRATYQPGWRWSDDVGRASARRAATSSMSGWSFRAARPRRWTTAPSTRCAPATCSTFRRPRHDSWVVGDEPYVSLHFLGADDYAAEGRARERMMVKLKDVYPLYLNNEAKQPNADLEVTDKFTGKVAFRCRAGRRRDDRRRHRRRGRGGRADGAAGELRAPGRAPALRRPLQGAVRRARLRALRRGREADQGQRGRGHPADRHLPHRRRGERADDRRGPAARHLARAPRAIRASGSGCRSGRAASSRRSTSRSTSPRTRSRRRSRSAARS